MLARSTTSRDKEMVADFLGEEWGIVDLSRDKVVIVESGGLILGLMASRQVHWVHEFRIAAKMLGRPVATALINYGMSAAVTFSRSRGLPDPEAMFSVNPSNLAFRRVIEEMGCYTREQGLLYSKDLR